MLKNICFAAVTLGLAACGHAEAEPQPQPDPSTIERLALAGESADAEAPAPAGLEKADRIVTAIDRTDPDRLGSAAERLLAR
jgi:hypothetical protein